MTAHSEVNKGHVEASPNEKYTDENDTWGCLRFSFVDAIPPEPLDRFTPNFCQ